MDLKKKKKKLKLYLDFFVCVKKTVALMVFGVAGDPRK